MEIWNAFQPLKIHLQSAFREIPRTLQKRDRGEHNSILSIVQHGNPKDQEKGYKVECYWFPYPVLSLDQHTMNSHL